MSRKFARLTFWVPKQSVSEHSRKDFSQHRKNWSGKTGRRQIEKRVEVSSSSSPPLPQTIIPLLPPSLPHQPSHNQSEYTKLFSFISSFHPPILYNFSSRGECIERGGSVGAGPFSPSFVRRVSISHLSLRKRARTSWGR